jgi:hypothetical protein
MPSTAASRRSKGWKSLSSEAPAMPFPLSSTAMRIASVPRSVTRILTSPPDRLYLTAFETRLIKTCFRRW